MRPILLLAALALTATSVNAKAERRSSIVVSPDLNAPWVLGFDGAPRARGGVRVGGPQQREEVRTPRERRATPTAGFAPRVMRRVAPPPRVSDPARQASLRSASAVRNGFPDRFLPQNVAYGGSERAGTIVIDTTERYLYLVQGNGQARRYGVGVGKPGFEWAGVHKVSRKAQWPSWTPPQAMIARERLKGVELPRFMEGGPANPLGARALYLGSSLYRIHGTNQPWTIGQAVSSGCIRMRNVDVTDLYERVGVGTRVIVK